MYSEKDGPAVECAQTYRSIPVLCRDLGPWMTRYVLRGAGDGRIIFHITTSGFAHECSGMVIQMKEDISVSPRLEVSEARAIAEATQGVAPEAPVIAVRPILWVETLHGPGEAGSEQGLAVLAWSVRSGDARTIIRDGDGAPLVIFRAIRPQR